MPIVDLRQRQPWLQRLPARLGTASLWLGSIGLLGPLKLAGLLALSASLLPTALVLDHRRRQRVEAPELLQPALASVGLAWPLARAEQAETFGLAEALLFQARHARICTVVYDVQGRLVELRLPDWAETVSTAPAKQEPVPAPGSDSDRQLAPPPWVNQGLRSAPRPMPAGVCPMLRPEAAAAA